MQNIREHKSCQKCTKEKCEILKQNFYPVNWKVKAEIFYLTIAIDTETAMYSLRNILHRRKSLFSVLEQIF